MSVPSAMPSALGSVSMDPVLVPFVTAADDETAREALGVVLDTHALPVVRGVIRREIAWGAHRGASDADLDDVAGTVLVRLTACLLRVRRDGARGEPIGSLRAYAAQLTANECAEWMRARFPLRARLTAQIRYACRHHPELALWPWRERAWVCGLAAWQDAREPLDSQVLDALRGRFAAPIAGAVSEPKRILAALIAVLREAGGPCRLAEMVTLVADLLGIDDRAMPASTDAASASHEEAHAVRHAAADVAPHARARHNWQHEFLARVWREMRDLPIRQRIALLLNLRDEGQQDALALLATAGIASIAQLAACVGMSPRELETLLPDLPQDDEWIARRLGTTRRQVINLRKCARERLARRMGISRRPRREQGEGTQQEGGRS